MKRDYSGVLVVIGLLTVLFIIGWFTVKYDMRVATVADVKRAVPNQQQQLDRIEHKLDQLLQRK